MAQWTYPDKESYIASFGNIDLHTEGGLNATIGGEVDMTVFQSAKLDIRKNADIDIGGNMTADVVGSMTASVQGATSLRGVDEDNVTLLSIDFDNAASKITLDSTDVEIKGNLKVVGTTPLVHRTIYLMIITILLTVDQCAGNTGALSLTTGINNIYGTDRTTRNIQRFRFYF